MFSVLFEHIKYINIMYDLHVVRRQILRDWPYVNIWFFIYRITKSFRIKIVEKLIF